MLEKLNSHEVDFGDNGYLMLEHDQSPADDRAQEGYSLDLGVVVEVIVVEDDAEGVDREV